MSSLQSRATIGSRRSRQLRLKLAEDLLDARNGAGISQRELARRVGVSPMRIARAEACDSSALTIDLVARIAAVLGMLLAASLYLDGDPVRDRAHLALLARLRARLARVLRWREEVPIPITGDRRSGDAVIEASAWSALVESAWSRLAAGEDPGGDALVVL